MLSFLYVKDLFEPKYEHLIKQQENVGQKHFRNPRYSLNTHMIPGTSSKELKKKSRKGKMLTPKTS